MRAGRVSYPLQGFHMLHRCPMHRLAPLLVLVSGCYGYYPITESSPAGHDVQVTLTDSGAVALARQIGPFADALNGRLVSVSGNDYVLAMASVHQRDGNETSWRGERVAVPRPLVARLEERRFSRGRTTLFSGAVAIALVAVRQAFQGTGSSSPGSGLSTGGTGK